MLKKSLRYISVSWEGGVQRFSRSCWTLLLLVVTLYFSNGWYCRVDKETGELVDPKVRQFSQTLEEEF